MVNNTTTEPFSLNKMFKPKPGNPTLAKLMKELSALKYGRSRAEIDLQMSERMRMN